MTERINVDKTAKEEQQKEEDEEDNVHHAAAGTSRLSQEDEAQGRVSHGDGPKDDDEDNHDNTHGNDDTAVVEDENDNLQQHDDTNKSPTSFLSSSSSSSSSPSKNEATATDTTLTASHKASTKLPPMNLLQCHKFHTHPAVSHPNSSSSFVSLSSSSSSSNRNHSSSTTKRNHTTSSSYSTKTGTGLACHNRWAPNTNHCKNAELLAIASPISPTAVMIGSSSSFSPPWQQGTMVHTTTSATSNISASTNAATRLGTGGGMETTLHSSSSVVGSHVYVLVFDEGTFAHCTDFSLGDELCELFGMPTDKVMGRKKRSRKRRKEGVERSWNDCGLRRKVFCARDGNGSSGNEKGVDCREDNRGVCKGGKENDGGGMVPVVEKNVVEGSGSDGDGEGDGDADADAHGHKTNGTFSSFSCPTTNIWQTNLLRKTQSVCGDIAVKIIRPLAFHIWDEICNCFQLFQYQVFHDGRIFRLGFEDDEDEDDDDDEEDVDAVHIRETSSEDSVPCLVRPQLVYHIKLPYSTTSMEVTGLEWNNDGTVLSITQRKKVSAVGGSYMVASSCTNLTNKKKKSSASSSSCSVGGGGGGGGMVSPGNTAISFWSAPEWLHVLCDDLKVCHDDETLRCKDGEGGIIKASHRSLEDTAGWETAIPDDSRPLFPMWEWYLSRHVLREEHKMENQQKTKRTTRIMIKNSMDYNAYPMELMDTSSLSSGSMVKQVKRTPRGIKPVSHTSENANAILNGDITCLFWEESPIIKNDFGVEGSDLDDKKMSGSSEGNDNSGNKGKNSNLIVASKWVAVGTSKGQVILHNCVASLSSFQSKKVSKKASGKDDSKTVGLTPDAILPQARTISVPVRHKKRITCGTWVDNLLVFGQLSTGCLTVVSTCAKSSIVNDNVGFCDRMDLFSEKSAKVLGNIVLPGGRDAAEIKIRDLVTDVGSLSVLSVNCEGKSLLFYTFPKFINSINVSTQASDIISSPAIEVIFSTTSSSSAEEPLTTKSGIYGNIICHYPIPNTLLVLVGFSCGYFVLVDWANGVILSDESVVQRSYHKSKNESDMMSRDFHENFLLDVAYHEETSTFACMTKNGHVLVYHIRVLEGYHDVQAGDCKCSTGIIIHTKNHTKPKTKVTKSLVDCDSSLKRIMGTIDYSCAHSLPSTPCLQGDTRKEELINFSSDGECLSVSLGDESVIILSINADDDEVDRLKRRLANFVYLGRKKLTLTLLTSFAAILLCSSIITSPETTRQFLIRLFTMLQLNNSINR